MADDMTSEQRRGNMQHICSKDTSIEVKLRMALCMQVLDLGKITKIDWKA